MYILAFPLASIAVPQNLKLTFVVLMLVDPPGLLDFHLLACKMPYSGPSFLIILNINRYSRERQQRN